jgi:CHAT domain-containing protein/tetratricopeptide (TPR) repeat protein
MVRTAVVVVVCCLVRPAGAGAGDAVEKPAAPRLPWQRLLQGADARKAAEMDGRVVAAWQAGKWEEAVRAAEELLQLRQQVQGKDHWQALTAHWHVQTLRAVQRQSKEVQQEYAGLPEQQTRANALVARGRYREAQPLLEKQRDIRRKVLGEEHPDTAMSYNNVGLNLQAQGQYAAAAEVYQKALDIQRKVLGEEHPDTARSYNNVATNLQAQGQYAAAAEGYQKALAIRRKVLGEEHPDTAQSYNGVAYNLKAQGKYAAAAEGYQKALAIRRKVLGEEHPDTAQSYNNVAANLQAQGQYAAAAEGFQKALAINRKVLGEEHPDTANSYNNVAFNLNAQGQYAAAQERLQKALDINCMVLGEEHPDTANCYSGVAFNSHARGRYAEAERSWLRAAAAFAKARSRLAHSGLQRAAFSSEHSPLPALAAVLARNGNPHQAWQRFEESLARSTWDDLSARLRRPPAEVAQQAALNARLERLDRLIEKAVAVKDETATQKQQREALLGERRKVQEELDAFVAHLEKTYGPAAGEVFDLPRLQRVLAEDAALLGWIDVPPIGPKAADANGEHWAFLLRGQGEPVCVRLTGSGIDGAWTEGDSRLPGELRSVVLEHRGGWQLLAQRLREQRLGPLSKHLAAHDGLPAVRHLIVLPSPALAGVPVELLAEGCTVSYAHSGTLHAHLRTQPKVKTAGLFALADPVFEVRSAASREEPLPAGGVLLTLVQPDSNAARSHLRPGDVVLRYKGHPVSAAADLAPLIAAAAEEKSIQVTLWRDGKTVDRAVAPGKLGVVLADKPAPEAVKERRRLDRRLTSRGDDSWRELPGTRVEVASITRLFGDSPAPAVLTDSEASEQNLYELAQSGALQKYRYLHLATHGEVDDAFPLRSAVILSRDHLPDPGQQLLAGKPVFDGRLTAEEVLRQWHLDCDLVTLSACQTALGKYERGEGFVGFAQALTLCGSRSVCLSLWQVDDAATALLMQRFYANLLGKRDGLKGALGKAAALAEAKRWLRTLPRAQALKQAAAVYQGIERGKGRTKPPLLPALPEPTPEAKEDCPYAHPYYWAAFVLTGAPD